MAKKKLGTKMANFNTNAFMNMDILKEKEKRGMKMDNLNLNVIMEVI